MTNEKEIPQPMTEEAALRVTVVDDVLHVAVADVAAMLLDLARRTSASTYRRTPGDQPSLP
ncbi:MAG: hypothetical protein M3Q47_06145 [Actinomycetota bacterium]|nr:hypothetical protein [Actinomycetota bacterium]